MLLYVARHAQTASSAVDSFNGQRELPLTEQGREQARKLGQRLAGCGSRPCTDRRSGARRKRPH